jgi:hypothetical protein
MSKCSEIFMFGFRVYHFRDSAGRWYRRGGLPRTVRALLSGATSRCRVHLLRHAHTHTHTHTHTHIHPYIHTNVCIYTYVCMCVCMYVYTCVCMYVCIYVSMYVCMYTCIHTHTHTHTHTHKYSCLTSPCLDKVWVGKLGSIEDWRQHTFLALT